MDGSLIRRSRIVVVGSGIAGLAASWLLRHDHDVSLHEAEPRFGGHAHTQEVLVDQVPVAVDTGFIVYNPRNYPNLVALFDTLGVETKASDMSFSVSLENGGLEYAGGRPLQLFAQPANLVRPRFLSMLWDLVRFYRSARAVAAGPQTDETLGAFLQRNRYGDSFLYDHLLPMGAAIWSAPTSSILEFPLSSFVRFFDNHGLLQFFDRPAWRTVVGGSQRYVGRILRDLGGRAHASSRAIRVERNAGNSVVTFADGQRIVADHVILAVHGDTARTLLADPDGPEAEALGSFRTSDNRAVLHTDQSLMPKRRAAWASWNYQSIDPRSDRSVVTLTYWMNLLQGLQTPRPLLVTLNPLREPSPNHVLAEMRYRHPLYDLSTYRAQAKIKRLQGLRGVWFCGAWLGDGFHEDGLASAVEVVSALGSPAPWSGSGVGASVA